MRFYFPQRSVSSFLLMAGLVFSCLFAPALPVFAASTVCVLGDIDCSGKVNALDITFLLANFETHYQPADLDTSGKVNSLDLAILLTNFGGLRPTATPIDPLPTLTPKPTITPRPSTSPDATPTSVLTPTIEPTVEPTVTTVPTPTTITTGCAYPSQVLDLTNWKMTLPVTFTNSKGEESNEEKQLAEFTFDPWFVPAENCTGVRFRAHTDTSIGETTTNSSYLRSELRERKDNGSADASWGNSSGTHTLTVDLKVTQLPDVHPHLVVAQIHDSSDDVTVFRVEGNELWATKGDTPHGTLLDDSLSLNQRFQVRFIATPGKIESYYKAPDSSTFELKQTLNETISGAYFKTGAYVQSNCREDREGDQCALDNYGEVVIYSVEFSHE